MTYEIVKDAINSFGVPVAELMFAAFVAWRIACFFAPHIDRLMTSMGNHIDVSAEQLPRQTEILQSLASQSNETHAKVSDIHEIVSRQIPAKD